jgi:hypothetical protein
MDGRAGQPGGAARVQALDLGTTQAGHVRLDGEAELGLQVGQVAVTVGEPLQHAGVQRERRRRVDRVDAVLLVDRLPEHDRPPAVAAGEEVVEPAGAGDVAQHVVGHTPLHDRHLGLRDGPVPVQADVAAAQEVQDVDPALPALPADLDELLGRSLEPGGHHGPAVVPGAAEGLPVTGIPGDRPGLHDIPDGEAVSERLVLVHEMRPPCFTAGCVHGRAMAGREVFVAGCQDNWPGRSFLPSRTAKNFSRKVVGNRQSRPSYMRGVGGEPRDCRDRGPSEGRSRQSRVPRGWRSSAGRRAGRSPGRCAGPPRPAAGRL